MGWDLFVCLFVGFAQKGETMKQWVVFNWSNILLNGFYTSFFGFTPKIFTLTELIILVRDMLLAHYLCLFVVYCCCCKKLVSCCWF